MRVWHLTPDADRQPQRVTPGVPVHLRIGTWPIGPGQAVLVEFHVASAGGEEYCGTIRTTWIENRGENSYWSTTLGPFADGDRVTYRAVGIPRRETAVTARMSFTVGPAIHLALLWHHHQPLYRDLLAPAAGAYRFPWARLHALRDYFGMAFLLSQHPEIHLTIDFSPVLLWQLEDYLQGASDRALELTRRPASRLTATDRRQWAPDCASTIWLVMSPLRSSRQTATLATIARSSTTCAGNSTWCGSCTTPLRS